MTDAELIKQVADLIVHGTGYLPEQSDFYAAEKIISLVQAQRQEWISVEDELPEMRMKEDLRGGGRWYSSDDEIWVTDGTNVIKTQFFQVWPEKALALCINMSDITHWMPFILPSPPTEDKHDIK